MVDSDSPAVQPDMAQSNGLAEAPASLDHDAQGSERLRDQSPRDGDFTSKTEREAPSRSALETAVIMLALCMSVFLAALDITIASTAIPTIAGDFHSASGYAWIGSAYNLAAAAGVPLWGKVSDIFGRKPVLQTAVVVFFLGSALCGWATGIDMLLAGRAIQGVGAGGLIILPNICVSDLFSMRRRPAFFGIIGMTWALASGVGPILGGAFTERTTWRWCFWVNLPCTGVVFVVLFFFLHLQTPRTPLLAGLKAIDWLGSLLIIGATLMFLLGLDLGGVDFPWDSATVICLVVFGLTTAVIFALVEWKIPAYPVIPLRIFKYRSNIASLAVCFFHGITFISALYYLPLYFQAVLGANPLLSGVYVLPLALALSFTSAVTGILIRKTGRYLEPIIAGFAIMTLGFGLFVDLDANSSWAKIILYQIVAGVGIGPNFQAPLLALQAFIAPRDVGTATATFGFTRNLSTAIGIVVGGVIFQNQMDLQAPTLQAALDPATAARLSGGAAQANVMLIATLPPEQRDLVRAVFAKSLSRLWYLYVCTAFVGLLFCFLIKYKVLDKTHHETPTGLPPKAGQRDLETEAEAEADADADADAEKAEKAAEEV